MEPHVHPPRGCADQLFARTIVDLLADDLPMPQALVLTRAPAR